MDDQTDRQLRAKVRELAEKIGEHYREIEKFRKEDREQWKGFSKRLGELEDLRSQRVLKRRYKRTKKLNPEAAGQKQHDESHSGCPDERKEKESGGLHLDGTKSTDKTLATDKTPANSEKKR